MHMVYTVESDPRSSRRGHRVFSTRPSARDTNSVMGSHYDVQRTNDVRKLVGMSIEQVKKYRVDGVEV